ncbi:hypothetical protein TVAG_491910 [Trichomonas vaginalis G3]|uniref:Uncharacterized protein n=1 Tax=Trichomonas vaginalis (strain ATCC PRA-98 / G3) TaxID=412133 RepID=A2EAM2_TRIV3|nr:hypothetical protein TVAGG3_1004570 [Trichomonas vaginalis G3]EAY10333.1 hypothetical protein TVAG_491910 [Trichomonas vaginalis G3]KAI5491049.1 hypothetical protein TVAGG3_1004570 [Trichomonas vaginalis G3]|eukprot:XP_001322556.1 hypothetical protein [Trichomonas vaginalis G3]
MRRRNKINDIAFEKFSANLSPLQSNSDSYISPTPSPKFSPHGKAFSKDTTQQGPDLTAVSEQRIHDMTEDLKTIKERMRRILKYNHAQIFTDLHVLSELNDTDQPFKAFSYDCLQYFRAYKQIERSGATNKIVGTASLKSSSYTLFNCWKKITNIFDLIDRDGLESLKNYIHGKFESIVLIINDIVRSDKRIANKNDLVVTRDNLKNLIDNLSKNIDGLIDQRELMHQKPNLADSVIYDIKSFTQIYKTSHYNEFNKVNLMQSQLSMYQSLVLTALNDIIVGINSAFSWDDDFNPINADVSKITENIKEVIKLIELPPAIVKPLKKISNVQSNPITKIQVKKDPMAEVKDFTRDFTGNGSFGVAQLENFIDEISNTMNIKISKDGDVWSRLGEVKTNIAKVIQQKEEMQKEYSAFQDKVRYQSRTITNIMKERVRMEAEKANFESEITVRNEDLEERNDELLRQINETLSIAKRREEQLFQMRATDEDGKMKRCLKTIIKRMNEMIDESEQDFSFSNDDLVTRADKLSQFISKRRCPKCRDREVEENELANKMSLLIPEKFSTISEGVDIILKDRARLMRENMVLQREVKEKTELINQMKVATQDLKGKIRELSIQIGQPIGDEDNIAAATLYAINMMEAKQKQETEKKIEEIINGHRTSLLKISKKMKMETSEYKDVKKAVKKLYRDHCELVKENEEKDKLLKEIEQWYRDFGDFHDEKLSIRDMIKELDNRENPLTKMYMDVSNESKTVKETLVICAQRLLAISQSSKYSQFSNMSTKTLIEVFNDLVNDVHDKFDEDKQKLDTYKYNETKTSDVLLGLCGRVGSFLNLKFEDRSQLGIVQLLNDLEKLIERALTDESPLFISVKKLSRYFDPIRSKLGTNSDDPDVIVPRVVQLVTQSP